MANKTEISQILAMLAATYPRYTLTEETVMVYIQLLEDIDAISLRMAALECATNKDFFPSVHELREAVSNHWRKIQGIPSMYEGWLEILKANFRGEGWNHQWSHPLIGQAAELLGWPHTFPDDNIPTDRAHFFKAYEQIVIDEMANHIQLPEITAYLEANKPKQLEEEY